MALEHKKYGLQDNYWTGNLEAENVVDDFDDLPDNFVVYAKPRDRILDNNLVKQQIYLFNPSVTHKLSICRHLILGGLRNEVATISSSLLAHKTYEWERMAETINALSKITDTQVSGPAPQLITSKTIVFKLFDLIAQYGLLVFGGITMLLIAMITANISSGQLLNAFPLALWLMCSATMAVFSALLSNVKPGHT